MTKSTVLVDTVCIYLPRISDLHVLSCIHMFLSTVLYPGVFGSCFEPLEPLDIYDLRVIFTCREPATLLHTIDTEH